MKPASLFYVRPWLAVRCLCAALLLAGAAGAWAAHPSFDCDKVKISSLEKLICGDSQLAALDARMALTYAEAGAQAVRWQLPLPEADQQAWLQTRGACGVRPDARACLAALYPRRIAELTATYALIRGNAPVEIDCGGEAATLFFFDTRPGTLVVQRAGSAATLVQEKTGSGIRYSGGEYIYTEHQGEMRLSAGGGKPVLRCKKKP